MTEKKVEEKQKTLVIMLTGWLWRVIAMSWAITELAKKRPIKVITSWPLVFRANPYVKDVYGLDERDLFQRAIKWNDYLELEPYTDPRFFNDWVNWLEIARDKLWLEKIAEPILFLAEHEKENAKIMKVPEWMIPVLYQPFGSTMEWNGSDKSYRSLKVEDAQYVANLLLQNGFLPMLVIKPGQPVLQWCQILDTPDLRAVLSLTSKYPLIWVDSCLHHAAKAFWKKSVVIWAWTDKERYWYDSHINLRETPMVAHTPMRLPMNDFNFDISNQYTNKFTKSFLNDAVKAFINMFNKEYKNTFTPICNKDDWKCN